VPAAQVAGSLRGLAVGPDLEPLGCPRGQANKSTQGPPTPEDAGLDPASSSPSRVSVR
jgi:hypothetical protein